MSIEWGAGLHVGSGQSVDAAAYWRYVGRWSQLFVPSLLDAARVSTGQRVLDVATGTAEAAMVAAACVGSSGTVVGADISLAMLQAARARVPVSRFFSVAADGESLPFRDGCFDAVVCQLGLMFFPNPGRAVAEMRRVLHPGGRVAACVISTPDRAPMWGALADALCRQLPNQAHALLLSFSLGDSTTLERLFRAAGLDDVRVARESREGVVASFEEFWEPIEVGVGQLPRAYLALNESGRRAVRDEVRERLSGFESDGRLVMSAEMLIATGRS
jgi:ubiquinone/menaquinone biosynthesis C-methylase UbiE